jgi:hypothetical protein
MSAVTQGTAGAISRRHSFLLDAEAIVGTVALVLSVLPAAALWILGLGQLGSFGTVAGVAMALAGFINSFKLLQFFLDLRERLKTGAWQSATQSVNRLLVTIIFFPFLSPGGFLLGAGLFIGGFVPGNFMSGAWAGGALFAPYLIVTGHAVYLRWWFLPARLTPSALPAPG